MSLFIDILIIIFSVAAVYSGIVRGFVRSVMGFLSLILAVAAAFIFTSPVAEFYDNKFVSGWVNGKVESAFEELVTAGGQRLELSKLFEDSPDALKTVIERFGVDFEETESHYMEIKSDDDANDIKNLSEKVASPASNAISNVLAAATVFVGTWLFLKILTWVLDLICRLPVLSTLNSFLGFVFGLLSAAVGAWAISNISVGLVNALSVIRPEIFNATVIDGSILVKFFYDNSLIIFK